MTPYYQDESVTIYHGDCAELWPELPRADHVITDPPYTPHVHGKQWRSAKLAAEGANVCGGTVKAVGVASAHEGLGFEAISDDLRTKVSELAAGVPRWTLVFCDLESITRWRTDLEAAGLEYVRACIWHKVTATPQITGDRPGSGVEAFVVAHPPGRKRWNGGGRSNFFSHSVNGEPGPKPHPTTKPVPLMKELVALFTEQGDLIIDPFMGSGTTLRAAKDLGRKAIGIEIEELYCEIAAKRMAQRTLFEVMP